MLQPMRDNAMRQAVVQSATLPAPTAGWDSASPLAAMPPLAAVQLKNIFPQPGYLEVRRGFQQHAVGVGTSSTSVETLMFWNGPTSSKMFAAGGGSIYDVTASGLTGAAVQTGITEDRWQWCNMTTSAGAFLFLVNGANNPRHYNGTTWTQPSITGITSTDIVHVNVHKKRLWFVLKDTTKAAYLGTEAVAGAASTFELGSNFDQGGYLVAMSTWTLDGGSGPDDYAVFVSSKGQVAIYQGTDPSSASTWALVGVFNTAAPIGRRCMVKYGNAPLLITIAGVQRLSLAFSKDQAELAEVAVTRNILNAMNIAARAYKDNFGWEVCVYPRGTRLILNIPTAENATAKQFVMNTLTGAWCEFDGHNANCWLVFNEKLYFGTNIGKVMEADRSGADEDDEIVATGQTAYQTLFAAGNIKRFTMLQPLMTVDGDVRPSVGISVDFAETSSMSTPSGSNSSSSLWDTAIWDQSLWGGGQTSTSDWTSAPSLGRFSSVRFVARTGTEATVSRWGEALWGQDGWGESDTDERVIQINGFVVLAEVGGYI